MREQDVAVVDENADDERKQTGGGATSVLESVGKGFRLTRSGAFAALFGLSALWMLFTGQDLSATVAAFILTGLFLVPFIRQRSASGTSSNAPRTGEARAAARDDEDTKACPFCAERIKSAAVVCRWCGRDLPVDPAITQPRPVESTEAPSLKPEQESRRIPSNIQTLYSELREQSSRLLDTMSGPFDDEDLGLDLRVRMRDLLNELRAECGRAPEGVGQAVAHRWRQEFPQLADDSDFSGILSRLGGGTA